MGLLVLDPGVFATIQDPGRPGYRAFGVPPGGAFDRASADLANAFVGNPAGAAVLELTLRGGRFEARADLAVALAGASLPAAIEAPGRPARGLALPGSFPLRAGERLVLGFAARGLRAYLAVRGGFLTPVVLGSRSSETPITAGTVLSCEAGSVRFRHLDAPDADGRPIRVVDGPDAALLGEPVGADAERTQRVRPESNRMGLRLEGPPWDLSADPNRVSTPTAPGAVQVAGGQLLVLGAACGTMGGYPHVAHVIAADLDRLAQLRPGEAVRFVRVGLDEARRADRDRREALRRLWLRASAATD